MSTGFRKLGVQTFWTNPGKRVLPILSGERKDNSIVRKRLQKGMDFLDNRGFYKANA
jgi:hypothetical protein